MRLAILTLLSLLAFAGNSLLCRAALRATTTGAAAIDAVSFTTIRLMSGALALALIVYVQRRFRQKNSNPTSAARGNWFSALALFAYAICFSYAYTQLSAAVGALLLFGSVQATMIGVGIYRGERLRMLQWSGIAIAIAGLLALLVPNLVLDTQPFTAPPSIPVLLMVTSGVAWGVYSLRGKSVGSSAINATAVTSGNFARTVPLILGLCALTWALQLQAATLTREGIMYALASGVVTSGVGYAIWYTALPELKASTAATVQLSVPVIETIGGALILQEAVGLRIVLASIAILGGIALVIFKGRLR